ncbi:MAG TPA: dTMP kinase [Pyrinomonadaceae bacterium]
MRGRFITFEGIDGSGKSTQLRLLAGDLRVRGFDVLTTFQPGGTPLGRRLREAFLETEENVHPTAELLLFAADRAQHVNFLIKPALETGRIVISDRYADATAAYQGAGRGFDEGIIKQVIDLATDGLAPDLTLFFDISIEQAIRRTTARPGDETVKNRMDEETTDFYERVRRGYLEIAAREPHRFQTIDAAGSVEQVHAEVARIVTEFLSNHAVAQKPL